MAANVSLAQTRGEWAQIYDESSNDHYYYNSKSGALQWEIPADWDSYQGEANPSSPMHNVEVSGGTETTGVANTTDDKVNKGRGGSDTAAVDLLTGDEPQPGGYSGDVTSLDQNQDQDQDDTVND